jgi:sodium/pantothenate symporter
MILFGLIGVATNISPVNFLQTLIVFSTTATASTFVAPAVMLAFWRRATATGTVAAMLAGAGTVLALFFAGWLAGGTAFQPYLLCGLEPIVWGLFVSAVAGVTISLCTSPPAPELVSQMFDAVPAASAAPSGANP